jgi:recombination protein RecT
MSEQKTEIVEKKQAFSEVLSTSLMEVKDGLPNGFNITRFVQNGVALLNGNETLMKFAKQYGTSQIKAGLMRGAFLGLDALNQECHLVPYGSTLNFSVDYRGDMKLIKKYSTRPVLDVYAKLVRQGDDFQLYIKEGKQTFDFKPIPFNDGAIIGAFAVILYKDGGLDIEEMSLKELEKVRSKSKMSNGMAWKDFTGEMYKKTVIHRIKKKATLEFENPYQKEYWEEEMNIKTEREQVEVPDIDDDLVIIEEVEV